MNGINTIITPIDSWIDRFRSYKKCRVKIKIDKSKILIPRFILRDDEIEIPFELKCNKSGTSLLDELKLTEYLNPMCINENLCIEFNLNMKPYIEFSNRHPKGKLIMNISSIPGCRLVEVTINKIHLGKYDYYISDKTLVNPNELYNDLVILLNKKEA